MKLSKGSFISICTSLLTLSPIQGRILTPTQSISNISEKSISLLNKKRAIQDCITPKLKLQRCINLNNTATPALYILSDGTQQIIAAADSRQRSILAILDKDIDIEAPESPIRNIIQSYIREAEHLQTATEYTTRSATDYYDAWQSVAPLLKTAWKQSYPYNMYVPEMMPTGCVATAMAQIIYYHRYVQGRGSNSYYCESAKKTLSYKFDGHKFNFEEMLPNYNGSSTEQQRQAVADLMYACGVATNIAYTSGNSVVSVSAAAPALIKYLGYDPRGTVAYTREGTSIRSWETMIYEEINAGRPVLYGGITNSGAGHAFVIDGYSKDGLFHINWGWGLYDGYFALSSLNPQAVYPSGLTEGQQAVTIKVPGVGTLIDRTYYSAGITATDARSMQLLWRMGGNSEEKSAVFGILATHADSEKSIFIAGSDTVNYNINNLGEIERIRTLKLNLDTLKQTDGKWTLLPAVNETRGKTYTAAAMRNYANSATAEVTKGVISVKLDAIQTTGIQILQFKPEHTIYEKETAKFSFKIANNTDTDFHSNIGICISTDAKNADAMPRSSVYVQLRSGAEAQYTFPEFSLNDKKAGDMLRGEYYVWLVNIDANNSPLAGEPIKVRIYGRDEQPETTAVEENNITDRTHQARYYNLNGIEISQPTSPGIYILRKGSTTRKIIIR